MSSRALPLRRSQPSAVWGLAASSAAPTGWSALAGAR
jgi:hypothetical protein